MLLKRGGDSVFDSIHVQIGLALAVLIVGFMFIKGDEPERIAGGAYMLITLAGLFLPEDIVRGGFVWGRMSLDILQLLVFLGLAWHSQRAWLIWASAFQSLIVTGYIMVLADLRPTALGFAVMNNIANYGVLVVMAIGTFWAWQERRAAGMR